MGAFYGNITLKGPSQERVAQLLRGRRAVVAPKLGDYTAVFDSVCDDQEIDAIENLTSRLSADLHCPAWAVLVHDDDVLWYSLYQDGALVDSYNSCPSYFDFGSVEEPRGPAGGNAEHLCAAFGVRARNAVESVLRKERGKEGYVFETERHRDLVSLLETPALAISKALASFDRGEYPGGLSADKMLWAADPPPPENPQLRRDRQFYDKLGAEDPSRPCKREGCGRGAIRNSVMCKRHHFEMIERRDCPFDD